MQNVSFKRVLLFLCFSMSELEKLYARFLRRVPAKGKAADHYDDKARKVVIESRLVLFICYLFLELSLIQGSIISHVYP